MAPSCPDGGIIVGIGILAGIRQCLLYIKKLAYIANIVRVHVITLDLRLAIILAFGIVQVCGAFVIIIQASFFYFHKSSLFPSSINLISIHFLNLEMLLQLPQSFRAVQFLPVPTGQVFDSVIGL
jgi:hypothetical protein